MAEAPRWRLEHLGPLPRPAAPAREDPEEAAARALAQIVAMQQDIGVPVVTDGALRGRDLRGLLAALPGAEAVGERLRLHDPAFPADHPAVADFAALAAVARNPCKAALPAPAAAAGLLDAPDAEAAEARLAAAWAGALAALHAAGCRHVQLDDAAPAAAAAEPDPGLRAERLARWSAGLRAATAAHLARNRSQVRRRRHDVQPGLRRCQRNRQRGQTKLKR